MSGGGYIPDEVVVPLLLRIPRRSFDAWNLTADREIPDEEYVQGIIDDDLSSPPTYTVERADP